MKHSVLTFVAGAFTAFAVDGFLLGFKAAWVSLVVAAGLVWFVSRGVRKAPEQRLERHLYGLRVVSGRGDGRAQ